MTRVINRFINGGWVSESPTGDIDGSNTVFTLAFTPDEPQSMELLIDNLSQRFGVDFTISGVTITMAVAPGHGQTIWAKYQQAL